MCNVSNIYNNFILYHVSVFALFFPVLASRHFWLLCPTPSNYAGLWHLQLSHTKAQLEFGQHLPCKRGTQHNIMKPISLENVGLSVSLSFKEQHIFLGRSRRLQGLNPLPTWRFLWNAGQG